MIGSMSVYVTYIYLHNCLCQIQFLAQLLCSHDLSVRHAIVCMFVLPHAIWSHACLCYMLLFALFLHSRACSVTAKQRLSSLVLSSVSEGEST